MDDNFRAELKAAISEGFNYRSDRQAARQEAIDLVKAAFDLIKENAAASKDEPAFDYEEIPYRNINEFKFDSNNITPQENYITLMTTAGVAVLFYAGGAVDVVKSCYSHYNRTYGRTEFSIHGANPIEKIARLEPQHVIGIAKETAKRAEIQGQVKVPETQQAEPAKAVIRKGLRCES